jgi:hypothetical protein
LKLLPQQVSREKKEERNWLNWFRLAPFHISLRGGSHENFKCSPYDDFYGGVQVSLSEE